MCQEKKKRTSSFSHVHNTEIYQSVRLRRSLSFRSRRRILPLAFLGIAFTNSMPPFNLLYLDLCFSTCLQICLANVLDSTSVCSALLTTKALGTSPSFSCGTPITAASATAGCVSKCASSSAGATWKPFDVDESLDGLPLSLGMVITYLDLDKFFHALHNKQVFVALRA